MTTFAPYATFERYREDMPVKFSDKVVLVTGAASGIGRAVVTRLSAEGAATVRVDLAAEALKAAGSDVSVGADSDLVCTLDVADESSVARAVETALQRFGRIDVLCNNAGIASSRKTATEDEPAEWQRVFAVNLLGAVHFTKHVGRAMVTAGRGAIVNTASVAGVRAGAGGNAYSASKAALINFTQTSACDFGAHGIRVNAVCPGLIETGMTQSTFELARERGKEDRLGSRCELRRYGRPEEVAAVIAFLASDDASYVTGQALPVDGGNSASLNLPGMKV
ncbi:SDR family NAD(P)-dependent oxidoreductase [Algihabitans albus]|uniref:SDR family NAD(P)-dependent oxidoreductase n=1 Tax=Algihabitans albus TaxID=2164067 RepID=UPI001ABCA388|nr:SDR family NAD(P)-dependent oxidoreductase [Algihabitans albus]